MADKGARDIDDPWASLAVVTGLDVLALRTLGATTFEGDSLPVPGGRVFGGQVLGQGVIAAGRTVEEGRHIHSLHAYFLRAGDATKPIRFEVEILRDGGSFSARRVHALQEDRPLLSMITSFQLQQDGPEHSVEMPEVPGPASVPSGVDVLRPFEGHPMADFWLKEAPFDVRHVEGSLFYQADPRRSATVPLWLCFCNNFPWLHDVV